MITIGKKLLRTNVARFAYKPEKTFNEREKAAEEDFIRRSEREKNKNLKEKLQNRGMRNYDDENEDFELQSILEENDIRPTDKLLFQLLRWKHEERGNNRNRSRNRNRDEDEDE